jgi:hypothetical protein
VTAILIRCIPAEARYRSAEDLHCMSGLSVESSLAEHSILYSIT